MKQLALFITFAVLNGCAATMLKKDDETYTLSFFTGRTGSSLYDSAYDRKAKEICGHKGYEVLERSFTPSTLESIYVDKKSTFYWVVKCKK